ncbi:maleate cis-trans isomerase family protein [Salipiger mucosus]|uniref:Asp/Glu/Hydantoin racemase family protein n=1 Tax=Salipiger mucosus DSM 16094 TaxID=1123237 RepID=S9S2E5_9RHOB|nr:aspartate/glutamate racemase family protein [Salipiger mucosus]EPX80379.1 Asp/Glu/Hydantoin racemase family protein [Salipiger mucosus DSM 16094]
MRGPFPHRLIEERPPQIGLIVLQTDESIEMDFRRLVPLETELFVTRVPSGTVVSPESLAEMEHHIAGAAALFPRSARFSAVAYGCTSGTAQIGAGEIAHLIRGATETRDVTEPLSALVAACRSLGIRRLGLLSPYVAPVSERLREVLGSHGIETPVFGSFEVAEEERVARIDGPSLRVAAEAVVRDADVDGLFLSCTNLRTLDEIEGLEARLGMPVLASNQVLAWRLMSLAGVTPVAGAPGVLFDTPAQAEAREAEA